MTNWHCDWKAPLRRTLESPDWRAGCAVWVDPSFSAVHVWFPSWIAASGEFCAHFYFLSFFSKTNNAGSISQRFRLRLPCECCTFFPELLGQCNRLLFCAAQTALLWSGNFRCYCELSWHIHDRSRKKTTMPVWNEGPKCPPMTCETFFCVFRLWSLWK